MFRPPWIPSWLCLIGLAGTTAAGAAASDGAPDAFPRFTVPGDEVRMGRLRNLFWRHYDGVGPLATLWDEWMTTATLWPDTGQTADKLVRWRRALLGRHIDTEGYVATHQHASIAHQHGWPFPFWAQSAGTWGRHFSLAGVPNGWHGTQQCDSDGWVCEGCTSGPVVDEAWHVTIDGPLALVTAPPLRIDPYCSPFLQLRWRMGDIGPGQAFLAWTTENEPDFSAEREFAFPAPAAADSFETAMIPVHRHPGWQGTITGLRIGVREAAPGSTVGIQALFTQFDTRHTVNNQNLILASERYFRTTRDTAFLREQMPRIRAATRWLLYEAGIAENSVVVTPFVGHDGRSGFQPGPEFRVRPDAEGPPLQAAPADPEKVLAHGHGIGGNYWDLLPFGHMDAYATMLAYPAILAMAELEEAVRDHPGWNIPACRDPSCRPEELRRTAEALRVETQRVFWNPETRRFVACVDADDRAHDFGFTFLNLEMIVYGLASREQAEDILDWIDGERAVEGDTSIGPDIYHWRFAPRATTRRNVEWYGWYWNAPETIPWGGQVQDGGAVLGFSYHDLMARLRARGPDDARERLATIADWYGEVVDAGGYRAYYADGRDGATLQGGGTAGGLGLDHEFFESILVPQVLLYGFLGYRAEYDGFTIDPKLPASWPRLGIDRIRLGGLQLSVDASREAVRIAYRGIWDGPLAVHLPGSAAGSIVHLDASGTEIERCDIEDGRAIFRPASEGVLLLVPGSAAAEGERPGV